jgi:hypothetical protein
MDGTAIAIAEQLKQTAFGEHNMLVYPSLTTFRNAYSRFDNNIKAFCAYHLANFETMHNQQKYTLEHAHYRKVPQRSKNQSAHAWG